MGTTLAFVWGMPSADPWVTLTACALRTETIRLGTGITPVPRRRVQDLALELTTLDRLSGGRVVFGAGLGGNRGEFERFAESFSRARRVELLDRGLETLRSWFDGEEVDGVRLNPLPEGKIRSGSVRTARTCSSAPPVPPTGPGWFANSAGRDAMTMTPDDVAAGAAAVGDGDMVVHRLLTPCLAGRLRRRRCHLVAREPGRPHGPPEELRVLVRAGPPT